MSEDLAAPIDEAATRLRNAEQTGQVCAPIRELFAADDLETAYAVQLANVQHGLASGRRISGRKVGLTNPAVQTQLGVDQPDFGTLFADMAFADGVELPSSRLIQPRAEAEIALVLAEGLPNADTDVVELLRATAFALPALEIVDSRIADWDIRITDTIADNGSSGLYVVGSSPTPLDQLDVRAVTMKMTVDGEVASRGSGEACLDNPLHAALWLARTLAGIGAPLQAGDIVLTGALGPMVDIGPGSEVYADMGALGTVSTKVSS